MSGSIGLDGGVGWSDGGGNRRHIFPTGGEFLSTALREAGGEVGGTGGGVKNLTAARVRSYVLGRVLAQRRWHNNCRHDSEMEPY